MTLDASDVVAIQQLYAAYNLAADRGDGKAYAGCFTADGVFNADPLVVEGAEALTAFGEGIAASTPGSRHIAVNVLVEGEGDVATGQAYFMMVDTKTSPAAIVATGQYHDRLARSSDGWHFTERHFRPDTPLEPTS